MRTRTLAWGGGTVVAACVVTTTVLIHGWNTANDRNQAAADASVAVAAAGYADRVNGALRASPLDQTGLDALRTQGISITVGAEPGPGTLTLTFSVLKPFRSPPIGNGAVQHCYTETLTSGATVSSPLAEIPCRGMGPLIDPNTTITAP